MRDELVMMSRTDCPVSPGKSNTWSKFVFNRNTRGLTGFAGFSLHRLPLQVKIGGFKPFPGRTKWRCFQKCQLASCTKNLGIINKNIKYSKEKNVKSSIYLFFYFFFKWKVANFVFKLFHTFAVSCIVLCSNVISVSTVRNCDINSYGYKRVGPNASVSIAILTLPNA